MGNDLKPGNEMRPNTTSVRKTGTIQRLLLLILVIVFGFAIIVLPHIDLKGVKARIAEEASSQLNGEVVIARASFSPLPWPHFTLRGITITSARWGQGVSPEIQIYLHLLPLLKKEILLKRIFVKGPVLDVTLREGAIERKKDILSYIDQNVTRGIPSLTLEGGMVNILRPDDKEPFLTLQGVTGNVASRKEGKVGLELSFACPGAERIVVRVSTSEKDAQGKPCSLLATGTGVNVEKIGKVVLEVLGKNETIQTVFGIMQDGELSQIIFHGEGRDFREALDFERNVRVRGTLANGRMLTPPGPLPLEEVSGEFEIEEAVLHCWDADLRLGKSTAREGKLVVGLISARDEFQLEGLVEAEAEDLVHYLPLVLKEDGLRREVESFQEATGRGKGRLVLGENIHQIRPQVEVESFQCSFRHGHSPGRISLDGGQLTLQNGEAEWRIDTVTWKGCQWRNAEGNVTFRDQGMEITVAKADLCGIHSTGSVHSRAGVITHSFRFWAEEADLSSAILCLWDKDARIEGKFLLDGDMWAEGVIDPLREASEGSLLFISQKGRIYRWTVLSQIFNMLNIIGLFEGKLPDFTQEGFQFDQFIITGELRNGYIYLKEAVIDGPAMKIVGEGKIDLLKGEADIAVLVAPLKTVDTVMKNIPVVGRIITGKNGIFISVPFSVKGPLDDAKVTLLPPEAVGGGLWGVLKRTLQTPVKLFNTTISKK
jgi:hypothetical protein